MDLRKLQQLIALVQQSGISELEISGSNEQVRIKRASNPVCLQYYTGGDSAPLPPASAIPGIVTPPPVVDNTPRQHAPMTGTCYLSPAPQAQPFVSVGQQVQAGDTLCIIEAMKLMNEITAERSGVIRAILVHSGQALNCGDPLFAIE